jgi:TolB-like protein/tetratricopeptide (TPR) repeat protein
MKCLSKRPSDRPQRADELVHALDEMVTPSGGMPPAGATPGRRLRDARVAVVAVALTLGILAYWRWHAPAAAAGALRTIAVLPFENKNGDTAYDYLAEGIGDELRSSLHAIPGLSVKARSSSAQLRGKSAREAGTRLDVADVVEGSISRSGTRLHVTAELVNTSDENTLWSGTFDQPVTDLAGVQDSIVHAIASALRVSAAAGGSGTTLASDVRGTSNVEAYDLFLKGQFLRRRFDVAGSIPLLKQAVEKDPRFARAHASLTTSYAFLPLVGIAMRDSTREQASKSVDRALALAPTLASAYVAKGLLQIDDMKYAEADADLQRAIALDSADAEAHLWHAFVFGYLGRFDDARAAIQTSVRLDPLSSDALVVVQAIELNSRRFRETIDAAKPILDIDPKAQIAYLNVAEAYAFLGKPDSARIAAETMVRIDPKAFGVRLFAMFVYASGGAWKEAEEQRRLVLQEPGNSPNYNQALIGLVFGDLDAAMAATERGVHAREPLFNTLWISCEPLFDPLRSRPRFAALIRELGATMCTPHDRWPIPAR